MRMKKKKGELDYNADIPFEKHVPRGFYDTSEEKNRTVDPGKLTNVHLSKLNRRRADIEEEKQLEKKRKARKEGGNKQQPEGNQGRFVLAKDSKAIQQQEQEQIAKRRKLVLPAPQIGQNELEEVVKQGFAIENTKNLVQGDEDGTTSGLVGDYSATPRNLSSIRTPRTAPEADNLMNEARNLRMLTATQTPLLGEENTPMRMANEGTGFEGSTPRTVDITTPNPLLTPRTDMSDTSSIVSTPRKEMSKGQARRSLLQGLAGLPMPRNEYEIRLPDLDDQKEDAKAAEAKVEDMSDVEKRTKEIEELEGRSRRIEHDPNDLTN